MREMFSMIICGIARRTRTRGARIIGVAYHQHGDYQWRRMKTRNINIHAAAALNACLARCA